MRNISTSNLDRPRVLLVEDDAAFAATKSSSAVPTDLNLLAPRGSGLARGNAVTGISPLQESLYNRRCKLSPDRKIGAAESDQTSEPTGAEAQYAAASCDVPPN